MIIFLSSFLIDVDHYLYYVYKKRDWGLKNSYKYFMKKRDKVLFLSRRERKKVYSGFYFLHGFESLVILFLLSFISKYFLYILIGFGFHLAVDIIETVRIKDRVEKISAIYDYLKFKKLKKE